MISERLAKAIAWRHRITGQHSGTSVGFGAHGEPTYYHHTNPPLLAVEVPSWLRPGIRIRCTSGGDTVLEVVEVAAEMCWVRGDPEHAVETAKLAAYWEPVPSEAPSAST